MSDKLDHYLQHWNLRDPQRIAQTPTSEVYTVMRDSERVVLKILTPIGVDDELNGAIALRYFDGQGAVRLLAHDDEAHLLEYVAGEELTQMVGRGEDAQAAGIIAGVLNKLHLTRPDAPTQQLTPLKQRFRSLFRQAKTDQAARNDTIFVRGARVAEHLLANPQDEAVLHGDMHHQNVKWHPERGWLAFDPKGLYGERAYDTGNVLMNPPNAAHFVFSEARYLHISQVLADNMQLDLQRVRAFGFAHACLSAVWSQEDSEGIGAWSLKVAKIAEPHVKLSL